MTNIPFILVYSRIILAVVIGFLAYFTPKNFALLIVILMIIGLLTDVFDGIIARKLNVSTKKLRVLDSNVDMFFWIITITSIFYLNVSFIKNHILLIAIIVVLEICAYIICLFKFKKTIATHTLLAKLWTITLLIFLIDLTLNNSSKTAFYACVVLGVISRLEIILIILNLKKWTSDIPSFFAVSKINKGEKVKKHKLFNS